MTPAQLLATRTRLNLTQSQLAEKLGLHRSAIAQMESGEKPIRLVTELAIEHIECRRKKK